jgi:hypothetical protein
MNDAITWLANTSLSSHMRDLKWLWPTCETLHFIGLSLLIGSAGLFDLRLMGFMRRVPVSAVRAFMPYAIVGFVTNLVTGVAFFVMMPAQYAYSLTWYAKLFFIVVAGLNAMLFETTLGTRVLMLGPDQDTPTSFKIVGAVSLCSWFAVLYCGRMLPYLGTGN